MIHTHNTRTDRMQPGTKEAADHHPTTPTKTHKQFEKLRVQQQTLGLVLIQCTVPARWNINNPPPRI